MKIRKTIPKQKKKAYKAKFKGVLKMANIAIGHEDDAYLAEDRYTLFTDSEKVVGKTPLMAAKFISKITNVEDVIVLNPGKDFRFVADSEHLSFLEVFDGYQIIQCGLEFVTKDLLMVVEKAEIKAEKKTEKGRKNKTK